MTTITRFRHPPPLSFATLSPANHSSRARVTGAWCCALALSPIVLRAQSPLVFQMRGVVQSTAGVPVAGAEVRLEGTTERVVTNPRGEFHLPDVPRGMVRVVVAKLGYAAESFAVSAGEEADVRLQVTLGPSSPPALPAVTTTEPAGSRLMAGFWTRRERESGVFLTREDIQRQGTPNVVEMLRMVPGVRMRQVGMTFAASRLEFDRCRQIAVFVDGVEMRGTDAGDVLRLVDPRQLEAMEVYSSASKVPAAFRSTDRCAAIALWSRIN